MDIAKYWKTIVDTLQDGLMVVDPQGRIVAANPAAERVTGYTADELIGRSCRLLNCSGCKIIGQGSGNQWCGLFARGAMREKKCLITNKDRRSVHIIKSAAVLKDENGQIIGAVETLTDITESIRQQQEIASLRRTFHLDEGYYGILGKSPVMLNLNGSVDAQAVCQLDPDCVKNRQHLIEVLRQAGGNQSQAAAMLGVSRVTVWKRMKKFGIDVRRDVG